jgi:hypothetical protein
MSVIAILISFLANFWQNKKGYEFSNPQPFDNLSGAYRNRTDDLLTASEVTSVTNSVKIKYITKTKERKK